MWRPFERRSATSKAGEYADLKPEIGQVMGAVWQIVTQGSESQREAAVDVLVDTRRKLYGILADGDDAEDGRTRTRRRRSHERPACGSATPSASRRRRTWASTSPRAA